MKYKYGRIDKLPEDPTEATLKGNFVHDVLEALYLLEPADRTMTAARQIARQLWDDRWLEKMVPWIPEKMLHSVRWSAWWCIENLWQLEDPATINPTGIEFEVEVPISGVSIKGFVDRWSFDPNNRIVITDYKTGKTPKPAYQGDKYFQLLVYALGLQELGVGQVSEVELLFLKDGDRLRKKVTEDDLGSTLETVVSVRKAIEAACQTNEFEVKPSRLCDWCSFKPICPYWNK